MGTQGGGPPNKAKTLDRNTFTSTDDWDVAVGALYDAGYRYDFTVGTWVTFTGYPGKQ